MPKINGLKFLEILDEESFFTGKTLVCSGGGDSGSFVGGLAIDTALSIGADAGLLKPFTEEELLDKVLKVLM